MSSLAAARADNFYYPPGFDPAKHGSLNKVTSPMEILMPHGPCSARGVALQSCPP